MNKMSFKESNTGPLICGIIMLASASFLSYMIYKTSATINGSLIFKIVLFAVCGLLLVSSIFFDRKNGLQSLSIDNTFITFKQYNHEKQPEITNIEIENIKSFDVTFKCFVEYNYEMRNKSVPIETTINIKCNDNKEYEFFTVFSNTFKIKELFNISKRIPNFSYNVNSNSKEWSENIANIAVYGKDMPITKYISSLLNNPAVPDDSKTILKAGLIYISIMLLIALAMIISIIKDIISWHNA